MNPFHLCAPVSVRLTALTILCLTALQAGASPNLFTNGDFSQGNTRRPRCCA